MFKPFKTVTILTAAALTIAVGLGFTRGDEKPAGGGSGSGSASAAADANVLEFTMKDIDGKDKALSDYKGKVVLMVNVASRCGYTPQYEGLEKLYKELKDKGFVILGFPANNFGGQEPGTDSEIKSFCTGKFNVSFPMFSKISVKGADVHPLYKKLASLKGEPKWNFTKYLVDKQGNVVERFDSKVAPDAAELRKQIDALLAK